MPKSAKLAGSGIAVTFTSDAKKTRAGAVPSGKRTFVISAAGSSMLAIWG